MKLPGFISKLNIGKKSSPNNHRDSSSIVLGKSDNDVEVKENPTIINQTFINYGDGPQIGTNNGKIAKAKGVSQKKNKKNTQTKGKTSKAGSKVVKTSVKQRRVIIVILIIIATLMLSLIAYVAIRPSTVNNYNYYGSSPGSNYEKSFFENPSLLSSELAYAYNLYQQGVFFYAQAEYQEAIDIFSEAEKEYKKNSAVNRDLARIQYAQGMCYKMLGDYTLSIKVYTKALATMETVRKTIETNQSLSDTNYGNIENEGKSLSEVELDDYDYIRYEIGYIQYLRAIAYYENREIQKALDDLEALDQLPLLVYAAPDDWEKWYDPSYVNNLIGLCYLRDYGDNHGPYAKEDAIDHGYTDIDAFDAFNMALMYYDGMKYVHEDDDNNDKSYVIIVDGYMDSLSKSVMYYLPNMGDVFDENFKWGFTRCDEKLGEILTNRAVAEISYGYYDKAITDCEAALIAYSYAPENKRLNIGDTYFSLNYYLIYKDMMENGSVSEETYNICYDNQKKALNYYREWMGACFNTAKSYECMGYTSMYCGKLDESIEYFTDAKNMFDDLGLRDEAIKNQEYIDLVQQAIDGDAIPGGFSLEHFSPE